MVHPPDEKILYDFRATRGQCRCEHSGALPKAAGTLPKDKIARGKQGERSRSMEMHWESDGSTPKGRKCAGEALGALPKVGNAPGKPWEHSQRSEMRRGSLGSTPKGRKCAGEAMGALPKHENAPREALGALPKARNARSGYMPCDKANGSARLMLLCRKILHKCTGGGTRV